MDKTELPYTLRILNTILSDIVGSTSTDDPRPPTAHLGQALFFLAQKQATNVSFVIFQDQNGFYSIHKTTSATDTLATTSGAVLLVDSKCQLFECKPRCCSKFLNEWISRDVNDNADMTCDNCTGAVASIDENVRAIAANIFLAGICEQIVSQAHSEIVSPPTSSAGPAAAARGTWCKSTILSMIQKLVAADEKAAKQKEQNAMDADRKREKAHESQRQIAEEDKRRSENERREAVIEKQKQDQVAADKQMALQLQTDEQNAVVEERRVVIELKKELKKALSKYGKQLATILKQDEQKKRVLEKLEAAQQRTLEEQRKRKEDQTFKTAVTSEVEKQMKETMDEQPPLAKHLQKLQVDAQVRHYTKQKPHADADPSQLAAMVEEVAGKVMARLCEIARKTHANELRQQQATKVKTKTAVKVSEMANAQTAQTAQAAGAIAAVVAGSQEAASGAVDMELDDVDEVAASEIEIETPVVTAQDKQMVTPLVRRQLNCDDAADVDVAQTKKRFTAQERFAIYRQNMTKLQQCKKQEETAGQPGKTEDVFDSTNVGARAGTNGGDGGDGDDIGVEKRQRKRTATPSRATEVRARSRARNDDDDDDDADLGDCNRDSLVFFAHVKAHFRY
jgi:hypothetical protein